MSKIRILVERSADGRSATAKLTIGNTEIEEGGLTPEEAFGKAIRFWYELALEGHLSASLPFEIVDPACCLLEPQRAITTGV